MAQRSNPDSGRLPAISKHSRDLVPVHPTSRIDYLEEKLAVQERTTSTILEKAHKIKEDLIENLNLTHGTWQNEKHYRERLQEHLQDVADIVWRLSKDVKMLEQQIIRFRENQMEGTTGAVKSLEMHHLEYTDLKGRVVRCDSSLAKLALELREFHETIRQIDQRALSVEIQLQEKVHSLERRMGTLGSEIDKSTTEHTLQIKHAEGDYSTNLQSLESKMRLLIEETRAIMSKNKLTETTERERMESKLINTMNKAIAQRDSQWNSFEKKMEESLQLLTNKVHKLEDDFVEEKKERSRQMDALESRLNKNLDAHITRQRTELEKYKREYREGFAAVHDSISNVKQVLDGKRQILEEQLRKEIAKVRKLVVLI